MMGRIITEIEIARAAPEVFDYVTTPAEWPRWRLASRRVHGKADHPLRLGEQVTEEFVAAGRRASALWTVAERQPPHRWMILSTPALGLAGMVAYELRDAPGGCTRLRCEATYTLPSPGQALVDWLVVRPRLRREADAAMARLKALLEAASRPG